MALDCFTRELEAQELLVRAAGQAEDMAPLKEAAVRAPPEAAQIHDEALRLLLSCYMIARETVGLGRIGRLKMRPSDQAPMAILMLCKNLRLQRDPRRFEAAGFA